MLRKNTVLAVGAVVAGLLLPSQAMAQQYDAHTRTDLNLRVGPGTEYGVIDVIPGGYPVDVLGCLDAYAWCDIEWDGLRGWVSARYLVHPGTSAYLPEVGPRIGVPIISFSFGSYHDRHYRDRPWHRERRGRWRGRDWRDDRRDDGRDRADERRDRRDGRDGRDRREAEERRDGRERAEEPRRRRDVEPRQERQAEPRRERETRQERRAQPRRERQAEPRQQRERSERSERRREPRAEERSQRQRRSRGDEDEIRRQ